MKILFPNKPTAALIKDIRAVLDARELSKAVSLSANGEQLIVTVKKLGTTTLIFARTDTQKFAQFSLASADVALTHKASYNQIKDQFLGVIEEAGGQIGE